MRWDWTISAVMHAGVLAWSLVSFFSAPPPKPPVDSLFVDTITTKDFSELTKGIKTAPKTDTPKPMVEKVADPKPPTDNEATKVSDKPEIVAAADQPPTPPKPDPKPAPVPQARPEPPKPPREASAREDQKVDPIAEAIKRDQKKQPDPKQVKTPVPPKKPDPVKQQPKFDAASIQAKLALLDRRDPQRRAFTGETINNTPSLGVPTGNAVTLTQNEMDALRARIQQCWNPPAGLADARDLIVQVRIRFNRDGSLSQEPVLTNHGSNPTFQIAAESAIRAVKRCAPYSFMPVAKYEAWKDVELNFDPRDMFRG